MNQLGELQQTQAGRAKDALEISYIAQRVAGVYPVIADAIINRDLIETKQDFAEIKASAEKDIKRVSELVDTDQEREWNRIFSTQYHQYLNLFEDQVLPLLEKEQMTDTDDRKIRELDGVIDSVRDATLDPLGQISRSLIEENQEANQVFDTVLDETVREMIIIFLLGLGASAIIAFLLIRSLTRPLRVAVATSEQIALGDLTVDIEAHSSDEIGQLLKAMGDMVRQLREMVSQVTQATNQVSSAAAEIAQGSADLSQRTEEQASALEETTAASQSMGEQSRELQNLMAFFKLDQQQAGVNVTLNR